MRLVPLIAAVAALSVVAAGAAKADPATPNFNLEVILRPVADGPGFGLVKFRQPKDADKIIYLDTWVRDLAHDHTYSLERAVDTAVNDRCDGTNWLPLGTIGTDADGSGRAALSRSVATIPLGTEFDIHFRVVDATGVVLESGCYQYVVSQ
jgi:hypothetical protein